MNFKLTLDAKLALMNTAAGIAGGISSFYVDRGAMQLGTAASLVVAFAFLLGIAYMEKKIFKQNDLKWYLNQGAFLYILTWLVVNGIMTTF